jgi:hypothetical protein
MVNMATIIVQDGNGDDYRLTGCECDNTHEANGTVCRWCWERASKEQPK